MRRSRAVVGVAGLSRIVADDQVDLVVAMPRPEHELALRLGLAQLEARAARDDLAAVLDEVDGASP
jgi:hypothetical protein